MPSLLNGYLYEHLFKGMLNAFAHCRAIYDKNGIMVDWIYVQVNPAFEKQTGLKDVVGKSVSVILPNLYAEHPELFLRYEMVAKGGPHERFEYFNTILDSWFDVSVYSVEPHTFTAVFENITERKKVAEELALAYEEVLLAFGASMEFRDHTTEEHTIRVSNMTVKVAEAYGMEGKELLDIRRGSLLHDLGKIGIPDAILLKTDSLTDEEWVIMKKHPLLARNMLLPIKYLRDAIDIPYCHHERWNGSGYPRGLKGEEIPLAARLFAVVDVYDALMSVRPYRDPMPENLVLEYLQVRSGIDFDPAMVELFLKVLENGHE